MNRAYHQDVAIPSAAAPRDCVIGTDGRIAYVHNGFELHAMETVLENELSTE